MYLLVLLNLLINPFNQSTIPDNNRFNNKYYIHPKDSSDEISVQIDKIFIVGNERTKERVITRELDIKEGQLILKKDLEQLIAKDKKKIINTRLFLSVDFNVIELAPDKVDIVIKVVERWYAFPVPIFSLADRNFNDWWVNQDRNLNRVEYGVRFNHFNFRGRNERLYAIVQFGFTRRLALSYIIPFFDKAQKNGISFLIDYSDNKNVAYQTSENKLLFAKSENNLREFFSTGVTLSRRESFYNTHSLSMYYRHNMVSDTIADLNPNYFLNGNTTQEYLALRYAFRRDLRDFISYPLKGFLLNFEIQKLGLGLFDNINQLEINALYSKYFDLKNRFYLSNNSFGNLSFPRLQPYLNFQGLGYNQRWVRGYELYVVEGQHYILNKLTFKRKIFDKQIRLNKVMPFEQFRSIPLSIYLKTYYDVAYVANNNNITQNDFLSNRVLHGTGIGVDIVSYYDVVVRLEYSLNGDGEKGFFIHFKVGL